MRGFWFAALPLVALAACNKSPEVKAENASVAEVAEKVAASDEKFLSAGQWTTTAKVVSLDMPGLPPEAQGAMKQAMAQTATHEECVTPDQVKKPDPKLFTGKDNENCRYDSFSMGGGKLDALMTCKGPRGEQMNMTMAGTYEPEKYAMTASMVMASPVDAKQKMTIKVASNGTRTGACKPGTPKAGAQ